MKKIPIGEATGPQLRAHAEMVLGLELPRIANNAQLIAKIESAAPGTKEVLVEDAPESPTQVEAEKNSATAAAAAAEVKQEQSVQQTAHIKGMSPKQAAQHHYDPTIEIYIPQSAEAGGNRDVPVSVNGMQWTIQRDKWVKVPYRVYENLMHAVEKKYDHVNDDLGRLQVTERNVPSYAFNTRNGPSDEDIAEWRERTAPIELA